MTPRDVSQVALVSKRLDGSPDEPGPTEVIGTEDAQAAALADAEERGVTVADVATAEPIDNSLPADADNPSGPAADAVGTAGSNAAATNPDGTAKDSDKS